MPERRLTADEIGWDVGLAEDETLWRETVEVCLAAMQEEDVRLRESAAAPLGVMHGLVTDPSAFEPSVPILVDAVCVGKGAVLSPEALPLAWVAARVGALTVGRRQPPRRDPQHASHSLNYRQHFQDERGKDQRDQSLCGHPRTQRRHARSRWWPTSP